MNLLGTFNVTPKIPEALQDLKTLACNYAWCWSHETIELFRRLDRELWDAAGHNPVLFLGTIDQAKLEESAADDGFIAHMQRVKSNLDAYMKSRKWYGRKYGDMPQGTIAYFSAEFGISESLPIYSGGLGILAGDHLKSASDLGLPLAGVGLLYQEGYFRQYLNAEGWQQEYYTRNDFYSMPLHPEKGQDGRWLKIEVEFPGRKVYARILTAQIGRVPLYLLDTNLPENNAEDRKITNTLYGGDSETRIQQEILLGIGGIRALKLLDVEPKVYHMNEGHSGFLALERIRVLMAKEGLNFNEARELVSSGSIFTTHTPVPAGIDEFPAELMDKYFKEYYPQLGLSKKQFLGLGRLKESSDSTPFNMANLGLRMASLINGVSLLHGEVSRNMWSKFWPGIPLEDVPISSVTNGVHHRSWISHDMKSLFDRYLGPKWRVNSTDTSLWQGVQDIPMEELWRTHELRREKLVNYTRKKLVKQYKNRGLRKAEIDVAGEVLDPAILTIGFARRFATYKRATLICSDLQRLSRILNHPDKPVQIIFAGKAHPRDDSGKQYIRELIHTMRSPEFRMRMVFLEDYDIEVARYLVQGVDVWLNNPRRPMEASGTSGMKVLPNGGINLSIPDGWWAEISDPETGWTIGSGEDYADQGYGDKIEANIIYDLLEREIVPLFYDRTNKIPRRWVEKMRLSMMKLSAEFNTNRMVRDYTNDFYLPTLRRFTILSENSYARAKALAKWKHRINQNWKDIKVEAVNVKLSEAVHVGDEVTVDAVIKLGGLKPEDVSVQVYYGKLNDARQIVKGLTRELETDGSKDGMSVYKGSFHCDMSGRYGYCLRIIPRHEDLANPIM
nr:alpha-glucan family phosphorylase [FCB group bacterium]